MFYPFQQLNDLKYNGSYWKLFHNELERHNNNKETVFWKKAFEIPTKYTRQINTRETRKTC